MKPVVHFSLAAVAAIGALLCWLRVTSLVDVPPIADGQPGTVSVVYDSLGRQHTVTQYFAKTATGVNVHYSVDGAATTISQSLRLNRSMMPGVRMFLSALTRARPGRTKVRITSMCQGRQ